jgi:TFIIF-interacting CTD phosphatase-like protein
MSRVNKLIVLDLDATLISAQSLEKFQKDKKNKKKAEKFDKQYQMEDYYHVFGRPHLEVFLDYIFENFKVAVWTAASQMYALSIIQNFVMTKPDRRLEFILFDYHNEHSIKHARGTKDLKFLESFYNIEEYDDMIILDDFEDVVKVNKGHSIKAPFFEFKKRNSHNDSWMLRVIPRLKRYKTTRIGGRVKSKQTEDVKEEESPDTSSKV